MNDRILLYWAQLIEEGGPLQIAEMLKCLAVWNIVNTVLIIVLGITKKDG